MKIFVTGVAGQLGHDVMNELAKRGYETRTVIGGMNAYRGRNLVCDVNYNVTKHTD
mgnify:CR=1 FL=1